MNNFQDMMNQIAAQNRNNTPYFGTSFPQRYEVTRVNGRAGAENFRMAPNSNYLLLDTTAPIIWLVQTDGSGLLTATPYDYTLHQEIPPVDVNALAMKVQQLEEELANVRQSNVGYNKQSKKQQQPTKPIEPTTSAI